jgi:hypothetical protein
MYTIAIQVIRIRVTYAVCRAQAFHDAPVSTPVQLPVLHVVITWVVYDTWLTSTLFLVMDSQPYRTDLHT